MVDAWRTSLKSRPKLAAAIASPTDNADLFEEGWDDAIEREAKGPAQADGQLVDVDEE